MEICYIVMLRERKKREGRYSLFMLYKYCYFERFSFSTRCPHSAYPEATCIMRTYIDLSFSYQRRSDILFARREKLFTYPFACQSRRDSDRNCLNQRQIKQKVSRSLLSLSFRGITSHNQKK